VEERPATGPWTRRHPASLSRKNAEILPRRRGDRLTTTVECAWRDRVAVRLSSGSREKGGAARGPLFRVGRIDPSDSIRRMRCGRAIGPGRGPSTSRRRASVGEPPWTARVSRPLLPRGPTDPSHSPDRYSPDRYSPEPRDAKPRDPRPGLPRSVRRASRTRGRTASVLTPASSYHRRSGAQEHSVHMQCTLRRGANSPLGGLF